MSKGSKRRPTDDNKYGTNWDKIFARPKTSPIYLTLENYKDFIGKKVVDQEGKEHVIWGINNPLTFDNPIYTIDDGKWITWRQDQLELIND